MPAGGKFVLLEHADRSSGSLPALLWNGYDGTFSIPRYIEEHAERLRGRYLAFVHDLGERTVEKRLVDHFKIRTGFSLWWMNRVAEKSPFKSARIYDCLRLLALEEILVKLKPAALTVRIADADIAEAILQLCAALSIACDWVKLPQRRSGWSFRRLYNTLPHVVQGLLSFRHPVKRWRFRRLQPLKWAGGDRAVFFCSYFFNIDQAAADRGVFYSRQWEALPGWLASHGGRVNFLHHYLPDAGMRGVPASLKWVERFNRDGSQGTHAFLESYLSLHLLLRVIGRWVSLWFVAARLRHVERHFTPAGSLASLWPLLRDDWANSLFGTAAVSNCLWTELFDAALADLPRQSKGLYLYEGQGWETAFIHAWRRHGHGELLAVPHSSMPFWYMNIYEDPRCTALTRTCEKPLPDRFAVNGRMARNELAKAGVPRERLVDVEALRFQYLLGIDPRKASAGRAEGPARLLVLGDILRAQTLKMLRCVETMTGGGENVAVTVKLHPAGLIDPREVPGLRCEFTDRPLLEIVTGFDFALSANSTSAGLDALLAGVPVAVFLDDENANHSPLRGVDGVRFVSSASELAEAVAAARRHFVAPRAEEFFWLDEALPRWQRVLSTHQGQDV